MTDEAKTPEVTAVDSEQPQKDKAEMLMEEFSAFRKEFKLYAEAQDKKLRNTRNRLSAVLKHFNADEEEALEVSSPSTPEPGSRQPSVDDLTKNVLAKLELSKVTDGLTEEQRSLVSQLPAEQALAVIAAFKAKEERKQASQPEPARVSVVDEPRLPGGSMGGVPQIRTRAELDGLLTTPEGRDRVKRWREQGGSIKDLG